MDSRLFKQQQKRNIHVRKVTFKNGKTIKLAVQNPNIDGTLKGPICIDIYDLNEFIDKVETVEN